MIENKILRILFIGPNEKLTTQGINDLILNNSEDIEYSDRVRNIVYLKDSTRILAMTIHREMLLNMYRFDQIILYKRNEIDNKILNKLKNLLVDSYVPEDFQILEYK